MSYIRTIVFFSLFLLAYPTMAQPVTESFTFQAQLNDGDEPANGLYDFFFRIFDTPVGGLGVSDTLEFMDVPVVDGLVSLDLDFGTSGVIFTGDRRWVGMSIRPKGGVFGTPITPRIELQGTSHSGFSIVSGFAQASGTSLTDAYENGNVLLTDHNAPLTISSGTLFGTQINLGSDIQSESTNVGIEIFNSQGNSIFTFETDDARSTPIVEFKNEDGKRVAFFERDTSSGGGGYLLINRRDETNIPANDWGVILEGNYLGTQAARLSIKSASAPMLHFSPGESGTDAVQFTGNAIDALEIADEPGVAEKTTGSSFVLIPGSGNISSLQATNINAPADGYTLVMATCDVRITHVNGSESHAVFAVSNSGFAYLATHDIALSLPASAASGVYSFPVTVQGVFPVSQGATTLHFLGDQVSNSGAFSVGDRQITFVFFTTAYGGVSVNAEADDGSVRMGGLTPYEIALQREIDMQADLDRQQREIEIMNERMHKLEEQMNSEK